MDGELVVGDLFDNDHVAGVLDGLLPHEVTRLVHAAAHVITPDKCRLTRGDHGLRRDTLEVVPRPLALLTGCVLLLLGLYVALRVALVEDLLTRLLVLLHHLVDH